MFSGITGMLQKQGNTEAVPVGRKSVGVTLILNHSIPQSFNNSQYIKNIGILLFILKLRKNQGKSSSWYKSHVPLPSTAEQPQASGAPIPHHLVPSAILIIREHHQPLTTALSAFYYTSYIIFISQKREPLQ
jgi:hypothetical protein